MSRLDRKIKRLYKAYLRHCAEVGIKTPATYDHFYEHALLHAMQHTAHQHVASEIPAEVLGSAFYVAARVGDQSDVPVGGVPNLDGSIISQCSQCQQDVWVDKTMAAKAFAARGILCTECLPEVTGMDPPTILSHS